MLKISCCILFLIFGATLGISGETSQQIVELMLQGKRKQAIAQIDQEIAQLSNARGGRRSNSKNKIVLKDLQKKKGLYLEQFITSEGFQKYQDALGLWDSNRLDEAISELSSIAEKDQDNLLVIRLRSKIYFQLKKYDLSLKSLDVIKSYLNDDVKAALTTAEIFIFQKKLKEADALLASINPKESLDIEKHVILIAKVREAENNVLEAIEKLKKDQEEHLDHIQVIYELAALYARTAGYDWQARKMFSLYLSRCRRLSEAEKKNADLIENMKFAQDVLDKLNKKLGV